MTKSHFIGEAGFIVYDRGRKLYHIPAKDFPRAIMKMARVLNDLQDPLRLTDEFRFKDDK